MDFKKAALVFFSIIALVAPVFATPYFSTGLPSINVQSNSGSLTGAIDLWNYAYDTQYSQGSLSFAITNQSQRVLDCSVNRQTGHTIDCGRPAPMASGTDVVTLTATNPAGASTSTTFSVNVSRQGIATGTLPALPGATAAPNPPANPAPAPTHAKLSSLPNITVNLNGSVQLIGLPNYVNPGSYNLGQITYGVSQTHNGVIECPLLAGKVISCGQPMKTGTESMTAVAFSPDGSVDYRIFTITVNPNPQANTAPRFISTIPDRQYNLNAGPQGNIVDLSAYAQDSEQPSQSLTYSIVMQSNPNAINCYPSGNYISCSGPGQLGTNNITVRATDSGSPSLSSSTASFTITILAAQNSSPAISGLSDLSFTQDSGQQQFINLQDYANDNETPKGLLKFSASQTDSALINCATTGNRDSTLVCGAPYSGRVGTSKVTIRVTDEQGASATDSFVVTVYSRPGSYNNSFYNPNTGYYNFVNYNSPPTLSPLPNIKIEQNAGYRSYLTDLWAYAYDSEDGDSQLSFSISQPDTGLIFCKVQGNRYFECEAPRSYSTGTSMVRVQVTDRSGLSTYQSFDVQVGPNFYGSGTGYGTGTGYCSDIYFNTQTVYMNDSQTRHVVVTIGNNSGSDFTLRGADLTDNSPDVSTRNLRFDSYIAARSTGTLEFDVDSTGGFYGARDAVAYIDARGEFNNGRSCGLSEFGSKTVRVSLNGTTPSSGNYYSNYGVCGDVAITSSDMTISGNSRANKTLTIKNNSGRTFYVDSVVVSEANLNFDTHNEGNPGSITPGQAAAINLSVTSKAVNGSRTGSVKVNVNGHYSDGAYCTSSAINSTFNVTVVDGAYSVDTYNSGTSYGSGAGSGSSSASVEIDFASAAVSLKLGESKDVGATIRNNSGTRQCLTLATSGARTFDSSVSKTSVCLEPNSSETITMTIKAKQAGTGSAELGATYAGTTKSRFVSVNVQGSGTQQAGLDAAIVAAPTAQGGYAITIENTGSDITDATITVTGLPQGVKFETVSKQIWRSGEKVTLTPTIEPGFSGTVTATARVSGKEGARAIPATFDVQQAAAAPQASTPDAGLVSLATDAGIGIGILVLVILAIIGIASVFSKPNSP